MAHLPGKRYLLIASPSQNKKQRRTNLPQIEMATELTGLSLFQQQTEQLRAASLAVVLRSVVLRSVVLRSVVLRSVVLRSVVLRSVRGPSIMTPFPKTTTLVYCAANIIAQACVVKNFVRKFSCSRWSNPDLLSIIFFLYFRRFEF